MFFLLSRAEKSASWVICSMESLKTKMLLEHSCLKLLAFLMAVAQILGPWEEAGILLLFKERVSGNTSLQKALLSTGMGSPGRWLSHHPWMCLKTVWMWCSGMWFSRGLLVRVVWLGCGWTRWSSRSFPTWAILWFYLWVLGTCIFHPLWLMRGFLMTASLRSVKPHCAAIPYRETQSYVLKAIKLASRNTIRNHWQLKPGEFFTWKRSDEFCFSINSRKFC